MASKKKEKTQKNNAVANGHKNAGQPQKGIASSDTKAAKETKSSSNPAKSPEQASNNQSQSGIWRKQKETNSSRNEAGGTVEVRQFSLKISQFLKEVLAEFRKINWPPRSQVAQETFSVLVLVFLFTVLIWGFDLVVGKFVFAPLEHWAHLYGIGGKS